MIGGKKMALCLVGGFLVATLATAGALISQSKADRDLTHAEMASLFGRQVVVVGPNPPCDGCYWEDVGVICDSYDPCFCTKGKDGKDLPACEKFSRAYEGFNTVSQWREPGEDDDDNELMKVKEPEVCYERYECLAGNVALGTRCKARPTENGTCGGGAVDDCRPCSQNMAAPKGAIPVEIHYCIPCN